MNIRRKTPAVSATFLAALLGASALTPVALAAPPVQQNVQDFNIAPQPLQSALLEFSRQSQSPVVASTSLLSGLNAPAVEGRMEETQALNTLLAGSGLYALRGADGGWAISRKADADPQGGGAVGSGAEVEALIVTAQKREEDIQDVPIAISAFTQEALERSQIAGGPDLITQVPNMTFTKTNFSSYSIQLRGIGTQAISATTDPGVAVALNNTPFIANRFFEQEFFDLQRVEVLRGPQGTLYGRNATAGVVNIITQKPKFVAESKLSGDVANYNSMRLEGMVNIPLVEDAVALRLAGAWTKRDGYSINELTGNAIDGRDLWSTRLSLRVSPNDRLDANLVWEHFEEEDDRLRSGKQLCKKDIVTELGGAPLSLDAGLPDAGQAGWPAQSVLSQGCKRMSLYSDEAFETPNGSSVPFYHPLSYIGLPTTRLDPYVNQVQSRDLRVIESTLDPKYRSRADVGELQVSWDLTDNLTITSETGYATDFVYSMQDFNRFNTAPGAWRNPGNPGASRCAGGANVPSVCGSDFSVWNQIGLLEDDGSFCDPQIGCSDRLVAVDISTAKSSQFSQEFRLASDFDGSFNFSLGANFTRFDHEAKYYVFINSVTLASLINNAFPSYTPAQPYVPGVSDNRYCLSDGRMPRGVLDMNQYICVYVEPNSIDNLEDQGHNYFLSKNPYKLISYAAFGEAYYDITPNLKVTAGLRLTVDKKHAPRIPSVTFAGGGAGYPFLQDIDQEWREPTGRLAIDWKPALSFTDETLLYASYARGYKAGGANPPPMTPVGVDATAYGREHISELRPKTFAAEYMDAFELGAKNTLFDGAVTLNLAAFYYDYKDYQISEIVDRSAFNRNFDATIWGIEVEADWRPLENLKFGFKGGYENTAIADGERAIDLMDRTAGHEDWVLVRPFPTFASSCIVPVALLTATGTLPQAPGQPEIVLTNPMVRQNLGSPSGGGPSGCELAYLAGVDPVTKFAYVPYPTLSDSGSSLFRWPAGTYPGWNPEWAPNNGEGFTKDLSGNQLPNAPEFTATVTADYTVPLPNDWLATLHTDLYWQSESYWRVFDDHEYNKLDEYFTMNLAAILTNEEAGWRVMAYVKNVFDRDSLTGAFLNSDDTSLTTNVFLTEPRLYGIRVTKEWTGGPLLGGFGARRDAPYLFELELGGQVQRHDAPNDPLLPGFQGEFADSLNPAADQQADLDWGDGRDLRLSYRPGDWRTSLAARFGKTNGGVSWLRRKEIADQIVNFQNETMFAYNYSISTTGDLEEHTVVDFTVGREVGFGGLRSSFVSAGIRYADLSSSTKAHIFGTTHWNIPIDVAQLKYNGFATRDMFDGQLDADRSFEGLGPTIQWEASQALLGDGESGVLGLDWSIGGGVLFGERRTAASSVESEERQRFNPNAWISGTISTLPYQTIVLPPVSIERSDSVTAPTLSASLGLSYQLDRFRLGAGYRWERYFDAIDGGFMEAEDADRTIDGPYLKVSVGFGG